MREIGQVVLPRDHPAAPFFQQSVEAGAEAYTPLPAAVRAAAKKGRPRAAAIPCALQKWEKTVAKDNASCGWLRRTAGTPLLSSSISFGITMVMAIACGLAAANICYDQPVLGIMGAALSVLAAMAEFQSCVVPCDDFPEFA